MAVRDTLLPEFDMEMASTRKMLERVPEVNLEFKPHAKSGSLGWLAWHVADLPAWVVETVNKDELDFAPIGQPRPAPPKLESREQLLASFDKKVADARTAIAGVAGVLAAPLWSVVPSMSESAIMPAFVVVTIGGLGSFGGAVVAGLLVGVSVALTIQFWPAASTAAMYVLMAFVLLVRPRGLFGEEWERFE